MKRKLYIVIALLLPPLLTSAARDTVRVNANCAEGNAFTIRVPVRFPDNMTVAYEWYRNDTLIAGTLDMLAAGAGKISHTVPADKAYDSAAYHFEYCLLSDGCHVWTASKKYVITFVPQCIRYPGTVAGSEVVVNPTPHAACSITVGVVAGSNVVVEPEAYPTCTITVGVVVGSDVVTEPVPYPACTITIGTVAGSDVVAEPEAYPICSVTIGTVAGSDVVVNPTPHATCSITVGSIAGTDVVVEPVPHVI